MIIKKRFANYVIRYDEISSIIRNEWILNKYIIEIDVKVPIKDSTFHRKGENKIYIKYISRNNNLIEKIKVLIEGL